MAKSTKKASEAPGADEVKKDGVKPDTPTENATQNVQEVKAPGLTFAEAEESILNKGGLIKLPEWEGFWFKNLKNGNTYVYTKDGKILDTPHEEYKERNDWQEAVIENPEIVKQLEDFHSSLEVPKKEEKPEKEETKKASKKGFAFEKAYALLKEGKNVQVAGKEGYMKLVGNSLNRYADNGDYLGSANFADLQDEPEWVEK